MQSGTFSDYRAEKWLNEFDSIWVALHYDNPAVAGAYASEVFGGSYQRVQVAFTEATNRVIYNVEDVLFKGLPTVRISHIAGWDNRYNGNLEFYAALSSPVTVLAGKSFRLGANMLAITIP